MARNRVSIESKFPAVKRAAWEAVQEARELWLETGQQTAEQKIEQGASTRGYNLSLAVGKDRIGFQSARIYVVGHSEKWGDDPWWARFFEYGTVTIPAMPFIRPGARKANKAFVAHLGASLEGKIRRRASVRR